MNVSVNEMWLCWWW